MNIRTYQPGDENAQANLYNAAVRGLPGFKQATPAEIARRYELNEPDPNTKFYAFDGDQLLGYIVFNANGRISYAWHAPDQAAVREPLLHAALTEMKKRGFKEAWAAYRTDWNSVVSFFQEHGFPLQREMVNYVADINTLPYNSSLGGVAIYPLKKEDLLEMRAIWPEIVVADENQLACHFFKNSFLKAEAAYSLRNRSSNELFGVGVAIVDFKFADPQKIDPAMPCFRLGAMGTETERHKRVNGLFSGVFHSMEAGEALLAEAIRRFRPAGIECVAAQAPSDAPLLMRFYKQYFKRQGAFPILTRVLSGRSDS